MKILRRAAVVSVVLAAALATVGTGTALAASGTSYPGCGVLRLGTSGICVTRLQNDLNYLEGARLGNAGTFDSATQRAVLAFQKKFGLTADGAVGSSTAATLINLDAVGSEPSMPAPANYSPSFNPGIAAAWARANAATDKTKHPGDPCTEFVSHAMQAGGLPFDNQWYSDTDGVARYINSGNISGPYVNAQKMDDYVVGKGWARTIPLDLFDPTSAKMARPGDLLFYKFADGGVHLAIVTGMSGDIALMSEQTGVGKAPYGSNVRWDEAHSHNDVPISKQYPNSHAYLLHWNEQPV